MLNAKRYWKYLLLALGLSLALTLYLSLDLQGLVDAVREVGWALIAIVMARLLPMLLNSFGWYLLLGRQPGIGFATLFVYRWIGEAVNTLLPVAQIGGDLLRARMLAAHTGGSRAGAATMVDFTLGIAAQLIFTLMGVLLLIVSYTSPALQGRGQWLLSAVLLVFVPIGAFYLLQHYGLFGLGLRLVKRMMSSRLWQRLADNAANLDGRIRALYGDYRLQARCTVVRLAAWLAGTLETWLIFYFMGVNVSLGEALIIESLGYAARSLGFLIPGALGIVESALLVVGGVLGISAPHALGLALIKRARELTLGLPALVLWYQREHKRRLLSVPAD